MKNRNNHILEGKVTKTIIKMSLPMIVAFLLQTSFNIIDGIFVGLLSAEALAAVSMAFPVVFMMIALGSGIGVGANSMVARSLGAKDTKRASNIAEHALITAIVMGIIFTTLGLLFGKQLFGLMGAEGTVLELTTSYANILFMGSAFMFIAMIAQNIIRGEGNMIIPMYLMGGSAILNIILDPLFIFTFNFGVQGAAIATVISRSMGFIAAMVYLFSGHSQIKLEIKQFKYHSKILKELFVIGIPMSISQLLMSISMFFLMIIVSDFGVEAVAAYGIAFRLDGIAFMPMMGMMIAVMTIVGHCIGAKKIQRARDVVKKAVKIVVIFAASMGLMFFSLASILPKAFNNNPLVTKFASQYLMINSPAYMFVGITLMYMAAFLGAGKSIPPLFLNMLRLVVLALPLAYALSKMYGIVGVWAALSISSICAGIISIVWFRIVDFSGELHSPKRISLSEE